MNTTDSCKSVHKQVLETELQYNLGRICHELGLGALAERCYLETLRLSTEIDIEVSIAEEIWPIREEAAHNLICLYASGAALNNLDSSIGDAAVCNERALSVMLEHLVF
jgi:hypothetical protein